MKSVIAAVSAYLALGLGGCGLGFCYEEPLVGRFAVVACDLRAQMAVCTRDKHAAQVVVPPCVFAVGFDKDFIIAAQHPDKSPTVRPDKSVTNYWILRVSDEHLVGPFTEAAFKRERVAQGVSPSLSFTLVFEDLK